MPWGRALAVWLLLMLAESMHGTMRTLYLAPLVGDFTARQISVFTGSLIMLWLAWFTAPWLAAGSRKNCTRIGLLWVVLTIIFEIWLGLAMGYSWQRLLADYNLAAGGLMVIGIVVLAAAPMIGARMRGIHYNGPTA